MNFMVSLLIGVLMAAIIVVFIGMSAMLFLYNPLLGMALPALMLVWVLAGMVRPRRH
jgi:hypothetical protein